MKILLVKLIELYQKTISPDHGLFRHRHPYGFCRFYPSCSEYTKQAIEKHGSMKGIYLGTKRIVYCNPYAAPKVDTVK